MKALICGIASEHARLVALQLVERGHEVVVVHGGCLGLEPAPAGAAPSTAKGRRVSTPPRSSLPAPSCAATLEERSWFSDTNHTTNHKPHPFGFVFITLLNSLSNIQSTILFTYIPK